MILKKQKKLEFKKKILPFLFVLYDLCNATKREETRCLDEH